MTCVFICVCGCQCATTPKGSCREEDRPHAMFPFEMEKDREGEMKGNRQSQGELASIFGSCGLPYLALFFFFLQASERHRTHTHNNTQAQKSQSHTNNPFYWVTSLRFVCTCIFSLLPTSNKSCCLFQWHL